MGRCSFSFLRVRNSAPRVLSDLSITQLYDMCNTVSNWNLDHLTPSSVVLKQLNTAQTAFSWPRRFLIHDLNNTTQLRKCVPCHINPVIFRVKRKYFVVKSVINNTLKIKTCTSLVVMMHAKSGGREMFQVFTPASSKFLRPWNPCLLPSGSHNS